MGVSVQLHISVALPRDEESSAPTEWAPRRYERIREEINSLLLPGIEPKCQIRSGVTIPNELLFLAGPC